MGNALLRKPLITARRVRLSDGRHVAYEERGCSRETARHSVLFLHGEPCSRLSGWPGVREALLERFGVRVVSYDRPGIGQSDYHSGWTFESSAHDMAEIADLLGMGPKFWVVGYSGGGPHAWAAAVFIPHRLAGVAQWAPDGNPYWPDRKDPWWEKIWREMPGPARVRFVISRHLPLHPKLLPWICPPPLVRALVLPAITASSLKPSRLGNYLGPRDTARLSDHTSLHHLSLDIREALRSGDLRPFYEDLVAPLKNWGFQLHKLKNFDGPIHLWQGTDDKDVPLVLSQYVAHVAPNVQLHELEGEGHYSWFCFNDAAHLEILTTMFGKPPGPLSLDDPQGAEAL